MIDWHEVASVGTEDAHPSRLGILGGSFDPIHAGHLSLARAVRDHHRLEKVLFVPNRVPPHKGVRAAAGDRYRMVCVAIGGERGFEATDRELRREGPSFTVDTLREIREEVGEGCEIFFLVGSDTLFELPTWREFPEVVRLARIVVVSRSGYPPDAVVALGGTVPDRVIRRIEKDALAAEPEAVSSTEIRERVARGLPIDGMTPEGVVSYIRERRLYLEREEP